MSRSVRFVPFVLALVLCVACHRDDAHDHGAAAPAHADAAHEHALARLGERYLVHLIHPEFVRGARADVLVHGTRLDTGAPIEGGTLAVVARAEGAAPLRFAATQRSPGAWPVEVTLPSAGAWTLAVEVESGNGAETVDLGRVDVHADADAAAHAAAPATTEGALPFLFESQWPVAMRFERVAPGPFTEWTRTSGRVELRPGGEAQASAPVAGRLLAPESGQLPRPGDRVAAGDVIALVEPHLDTADLVGLQALEYQQHQLRHELDLQQLEAERALGAARVALAAGTREVERAERLLAETLGTRQELDRAQAALELAKSDESAALASLASVNRLRNEHAHDPGLSAPRMPVVAPIAGVVAEVGAVLGETVEAGAHVATVVDLASVWAVAEVPERELALVGAHTAARCGPLGTPSKLDLAAPGHVAARVDPTTRRLDVAYEVANADGALRAGMLLSFELRASQRDDALTVPDAALTWSQGTPHAWVLVDGETFVKRRLRLGARDGARHEVLEGLAAGEVIVATHADELRLAALAGSGAITEHHH